MIAESWDIHLGSQAQFWDRDYLGDFFQISGYLRILIPRPIQGDWDPDRFLGGGDNPIPRQSALKLRLISHNNKDWNYSYTFLVLIIRQILRGLLARPFNFRPSRSSWFLAANGRSDRRRQNSNSREPVTSPLSWIGCHLGLKISKFYLYPHRCVYQVDILAWHIKNNSMISSLKPKFEIKGY